MKSKWRMATVLAMFVGFTSVALSSAAGATGNRHYQDDCNGVLNCNDVDIRDDSVNNEANADARSRSNADADATGIGIGQGGDGGDGGHGVGIGTGGDADATATGGTGIGVSGVHGSGNSDNSNRNSNANINGNRNQNIAGGGDGGDADATSIQGQGQHQGQGQSQGQSSRNTNVAASGSESGVESEITVEGDTLIDNSSYEWQVPAYADAGYANTVINGCHRVLGFDFRGSGTTQARGATFGVPLPAGACKLEVATARAFDLGNYELGWMLYCAQKPVWKGYRTTQRALTGSKLSKHESIRSCIDTAKVVTAPVADTVIIREHADLEGYVTEEVFNETVERAFIEAQAK